MVTITEAGHITDYRALQIAIKALRHLRVMYRVADTAGEKFEREVDRLIKRKTRMNAGSLTTLNSRYEEYVASVNRMQDFLTNAYEVASNF